MEGRGYLQLVVVVIFSIVGQGHGNSSEKVHVLSKRNADDVRKTLAALTSSNSIFSSASGSGSTSASTTAGSQAPKFKNCPGNMTLTPSPGQNTVKLDLTTPIATGKNGTKLQVIRKGVRNGNISANGTEVIYTVTYTATDQDGLTSVCSVKIKVKANICQGEPSSGDPNSAIQCNGSTVGVPCTKRCKRGYQIETGGSPPVATTCGEDGSWTPNNSAPACQKKTCVKSQLGTLTNGQYECDSGSTPVVDDGCVAVCNGGYQVTRRPSQQTQDSNDGHSRPDGGQPTHPGGRRKRSDDHADGGARRDDTRTCGDDGAWHDQVNASWPLKCTKYAVKINKKLTDFGIATASKSYESFTIVASFMGLNNANVSVSLGGPYVNISVGSETHNITVTAGKHVPDVFSIEIPLGKAFDSIKIAIVYDKTAGKMLIYVNGTLVKEETVSVELSIAYAAEIKLSVNLKGQRPKRAIQQAPVVPALLVTDLIALGEAISAEAIATGFNYSTNMIFGMEVFTENKSLGIQREPPGESSQAEVDKCQKNPCQNGGNCSMVGTKPRCQCAQGYRGYFCDYTRDPGQWAPWKFWGPCSTTCGNGIRTRTRKCLNLDDGNNCTGPDMTKDKCKVGDCPATSCSTLSRKHATVTCDDSSTSGTQKCQRTCQPGLLPQRANGSVDSISCGVDTGYQWTAPVNKLPKCRGSSNTPPETIKVTQEMVFIELPCALVVTEFLQHVTAKANAQLPTGTPADVKAVKSCVTTAGRRRRSTGSTITLTFSIAISSTEDLNIEEFYATGQVSPSLLEVVTAIDALSLTATSIANDPTVLNVEVNGQTYTVDTSSITTAASASCAEGLVSTSGFCSECAAGTYYMSGWCVYCEVGYYQDETGRTSCKACSSGYTTTYTGSTSMSDCMEDPDADDDDDDDMSTKKEGHDSKKVALIVSMSVVGFVIVVAVTFSIIYKLKCSKKKESDKLRGSFTNVNRIRPNSAMSTDRGGYDNPTFDPPSYTSRPSSAWSNPPSYSRANLAFNPSEKPPAFHPEKTTLSFTDAF